MQGKSNYSVAKGRAGIPKSPGVDLLKIDAGAFNRIFRKRKVI